MNQNFTYIGSELELFQRAKNWKQYWHKTICPYVGRNVLEVGAGIGGSTELFRQQRVSRWLALEPDLEMLETLEQKSAQGKFPENFSALPGTLADLPADDHFDTVLYIDVLEHIEDDASEVYAAASMLEPGGHLVILCPAFQYLFSPFDKAIGHYRRYSKKSLSQLKPDSCSERAEFYLDSIGMLASLANKWFLKSSQPTIKNIEFWDTVLVPVSRIFDPLLGHFWGRSVVVVWQKN